MLQRIHFFTFKVSDMHISDQDRRRIEAYAASQSYFVTMAEDTATELLVIWIRRNLPHLFSQLGQAIAAGWDYLRIILGF